LQIKRLKLIDRPFIFILFLILGFGLIILASATNSDYYLKKQILFIFIGIMMALFILRYDYSQFEKYSFILYVISIVLLVAVLVFGEEIRGTKGWIGIGPLPVFQPAEFTKIFLIVSFASYLKNKKGELNNLAQILPCFIYMGIPFLLIVMQPDLGTALVYIAITLVMMFFAGANPRVLITILLTIGLTIALALFLHFQYGTWLPLEDYQLRRLTIFLNPYEDGQGGRGIGWNTIQSLVAIGSGGLLGKGLGNGTQVQGHFLPEQHTDFIYAVIGEELGFVGAAFVILLYAGLILRAVYLSSDSKDLYGTLIIAGITSMWLFHIFENIGMSIGLMPITGIPLPFLSYGGSSMFTNLIAAALILSINIRGRKIVF
jgi:rod shape determining protein RodA